MCPVRSVTHVSGRSSAAVLEADRRKPLLGYRVRPTLQRTRANRESEPAGRAAQTSKAAPGSSNPIAAKSEGLRYAIGSVIYTGSAAEIAARRRLSTFPSPGKRKNASVQSFVLTILDPGHDLPFFAAP
jgi:hypothetical protein